MIDLYINIRKRREELGMSQDVLASLTGYTSRSSIAKIESGVVDLPQTITHKVYTHVEMQQLITEVNKLKY